jgi:hypothetical protein
MLALLDPDSWIRIQPFKMNVDTCGSGSRTLDFLNKKNFLKTASQGKRNLDFQITASERRILSYTIPVWFGGLGGGQYACAVPLVGVASLTEAFP